MELRSRYYTYPVITEEQSFYVDSSFDSEVENVLDGYNIKLILKATLVNPELEQMLMKGDVIIAHHIECTQTCYRNIVLTRDYVKEYILKDGEVNGLVQVCTFLIANRKIEKYSNSLFAQDFRGFKFDIEQGCILAVGKQFDLRVNKIRDDLANTSSIFSIVPNKDETEMNIQIDTSNNKIVIVVPQETFSIYANTSGSLELQPIMHSLLVIPALVYALSEIKNSPDRLYEFEDYRWYRSLRKASKMIGIDFDEGDLNTIEPFILAQKLMNSPIPKAVNYLRGDYDEED